MAIQRSERLNTGIVWGIDEDGIETPALRSSATTSREFEHSTLTTPPVCPSTLYREPAVMHNDLPRTLRSLQTSPDGRYRLQTSVELFPLLLLESSDGDSDCGVIESLLIVIK